MIFIIVLFSYLLETAFSNIISTNSIFIPLFLLTSLCVIYPYFNKEKSNFILVCAILGLLYDISFSDSIFINTISFTLSSYLIMIGYNYLNYNLFNANLLIALIIIFYRLSSYLFLCIMDYISFNENILIKGIYSSIIMNIIYGVFIYIILKIISNFFHLKINERINS